MHKFEAAGLGKAPFRYVGMEVKLHVIPGVCVKAGSSCDYCMTAIANCFWIKSADGRRFKVGCDCIRKLGDGDPQLVKAVDAAEKKRLKEEKLRKEAEKRKELKGLIETRASELSAFPHPNQFIAERGLTLLDWCRWMEERAGMKGVLEALKRVKAMRID